MIQSIRSYSSKIPTLSKVPNKFNAARSAFNLRPVLPEGLVHNPPASVPNSKNTPKAFLPPTDPRYNLINHKSYTVEEVQDMPLVYGSKSEKTYEFTPEIVSQIQELRNSNPTEWTVNKLAKKFNASPEFIKVTTSMTKERKAKLANDLAALKETWPAQKSQARVDRRRRVDLWLRNEF